MLGITKPNPDSNLTCYEDTQFSTLNNINFLTVGFSLQGLLWSTSKGGKQEQRC